jgi:N6-adenosine-specific RNA methylase IME4
MTAYNRFQDIPYLRYRVLYADPPWSFDAYSSEGKKKSADRHYDTMSLDEIEAFKMSDIAYPDSVCFLWITAPFLAAPRHKVNITEMSRFFFETEGVHHRVFDRWGFESKALAFIWVKLNKRCVGETFSRDDIFRGMGRYTSQNVELCFVGRKGNPPGPKVFEPQVVIEPVREHSRKPDSIRDTIARMYDGPRIELFGRTEFEGWDLFGNQIGILEEK